MKRNKLLIFAATSVLALPLTAQSEAPAPAAATPATSSVALNEKKDLISVDFPNEEIRTILRNVADMFEINLVVPETLQGRTSIKLRNVTWRQIFREVLNPVGYTFLEDENIIRVVSQDALAQEPTVTEVYVLNYAEAGKILPTISTMVDTSDLVKGKIQVDQRSNALVVTERPSRQEKIKPIIAKLDIATSQVMIESKFIEVTNENGKNVGMDWSSLDAVSVMQGKILSDPYHRTKTTFATAASGEVREYEPGAFDGDSSWKDSLKNLFNAPHMTTSTFSISEFGTVMSLYESNANVRLVSNPTVVTLNNVEASINIGTEYPIPNYQYNAERGTFEVSGFIYKPIGINLKVTPQVNSAGFIRMNILPEVSNRAGYVNFGGQGGANIPIIDTRKVATQVSLKDGHTLGIGGLIQNETTKTKSKVPFIGEIPVLGSLFKHNGDALDARNLIIFITARSLDKAEPKLDEVFSRELIEAVKVEKKDVPGVRAPIPELAN